MTESRTFDPKRPFRTRDGRTVERFAVGSSGCVEGLLSGKFRRWERDGKTYVSVESYADLVNIDEPAVDAGTQSFIDCLKTEIADLKRRLEKALAARPPVEPVTHAEERRAIELYAQTPSFRVVIEDFLARREMKR